MSKLVSLLAAVGLSVRTYLSDLGRGARLFIRLVSLFRDNMRRFSLVRDQIHFLGNYSLAIIAVSGLFVGFVLSLQGYYTLKRYGASEALGLLVALSLVRELGPVVSALLFAGRAGTSLTGFHQTNFSGERCAGTACKQQGTDHGPEFAHQTQGHQQTQSF